MFRFFHQIRFTTPALHAAIQNPHDPLQAIRAPVESLGGNLRDAFFTGDAYDVMAITEFPDNVSPADLSIAFYAGGAVATIHTFALLTASQAREATRKTASHSYDRRPGANAMAVSAI